VSVSDEPERLPDLLDVDRRVFDLQLERVRLRAMRAVEHGREASLKREAIEVELAGVDGKLASAQREGGAQSRERRLAARLGLGDVELEFLWTAVAVAVDPRTQPHAVLLGGSDATLGTSPSLHAALAGLDGRTARDLATALQPTHPLCRFGLLVPGETQRVPAARLYLAPVRVAEWLAGGDALDHALDAVGGPVDVSPDLHVDPAQNEVIDRVAQALAADEPLALVVCGPEGAGRRLAVAVPARRLGLEVLALDVSRLPSSLSALESALLALRRECLLRDAVMLVSGAEEWVANSPDGMARLRALARTLDEAPGPAAVVTSDPSLQIALRRRTLRVTWRLPETATRRALWLSALGPISSELRHEIDGLALRYRLGAAAIARAVAAGRLIARSRDEQSGPTLRDLIDGVRNDIAERLQGLATRIEVHQRWDDLVLTNETFDQIAALTARVRYAHQVFETWGFRRQMPRGLGVTALFSGPPGTGKTMVAGLIARELDLELYQVDLSQVISKWVGETEKQLARIFDAAEAGHALLLFDEADSLFARRTEVKSAVDRYANLEVNYLLQRVETFGGVTILTTNLDTSIDPALRRRLAAHIVFWPPEQAERTDLWKRMLPPEAPLAERIDPEQLARAFPDMTGANIRNAAIAAAFLAADEGSTITQEHLERAARGEYRAMGRLIE
jgi:SpoVK/Ycf46/Vps4 family AAA+-type ATPase